MSTLDLFQTVAIVVSLIVTVVQMQLYLKGEKISVVTRISERNDALLNEIIVNIGVVKKLDQPFKASARAYFSDPRVAMTYRILNFFDEMYYYRRQRFLAKSTWDLYQLTMKRLLDNRFSKTFWEHVRTEYNQDFQHFVDENIR